jgi:predicted NBD/HSP70 family sugar kinase
VVRSLSEGASPDTMRRHNRGLILRHVFRSGPASRTRLAAATGLTEAAISRITRELIDEGLLSEGLPLVQEGRPGRRFIDLELPPNGSYVLGLGVGAYEQWLSLSGLDAHPIARLKLDLLGVGNAERAIDLAIREARRLIKQAGIDPKRVAGFGAAVAGITDPASGVVVRSSNIGWRDVPLGQRLGKALALPVRIESLHHALNLAEAEVGQTRGKRDVLLINAALGIGASILSGGRLIKGSAAAAGQIGHMLVAGASEICTCGRVGCLDTVASGHAVLTGLRLVRRRISPVEHGVESAQLLERAMARASAGDRKAISAFQNAGTRLGEAVATVVAVVDPEAIVLAGPLIQVPAYVEGVRESLASCLARRPETELVLSALSSDRAGAWLALDSFVLSQGIGETG